jgi:hypothetical protein
MSGRDDSDADMPTIPGSQGAGVPGLPDGTLDALLTGDLLTDEAFAGLQPATALLAALNAAPEEGELTGHARALAEFRHRGGMPARSRLSGHRRPRLITSLLTAKAAAAAAVAVVALGGAATAAAYTGALPAPAQRLAHNAIGAPSPKPSHGPATPQATPARPAAASPDATSPAVLGLCTAYAHAKAHGTAPQKAVAFRNLARAAGGSAKIAAYCAAMPQSGSTQAPAPSHPSGQPTPHPTGKPSSLPATHAPGKPSDAPTHPSGMPSSAPAPH